MLVRRLNEATVSFRVFKPVWKRIVLNGGKSSMGHVADVVCEKCGTPFELTFWPTSGVGQPPTASKILEAAKKQHPKCSKPARA